MYRFAATSAAVLIGGGLISKYAASSSNSLNGGQQRIALAQTLQPSQIIKWDTDWDKRHPMSLAKPASEDDNKNNAERYTSKATRHIYLIRHGQYCTDGKGDEGRVLTPLGHEQSRLVGKRLAQIHEEYDRVVVSTMTRAKETADNIKRSIKFKDWEQSELLREGAPFRPEPESRNYHPEKNQYYEDGARIETAFRKYIHRASPKQDADSHELFICHANVIRYFVCRALQLPPEAWLRMSLNHASITHIIVRPSGNVSIRCLGESGFLTPDKVTVA